MKKLEITIRPFGDGWQASVSVVGTALESARGVQGALSASGAWVGGFGTNPNEALDELHRALGAIVLPTLQPNRNEPEGDARP